MDHKKKMVAPIVITIIMVGYWLVYAFGAILIPGMPAVMKLLFAGVGIALSIAMIYVLFSRIHEIQEGEEDDLSNY